MVLFPNPYHPFDNYTVVSFHRSSTLTSSNAYILQCAFILEELGEHESGLNQSLGRLSPPVLSLLGPIFLSNTWVTLRTLLPGALGKRPALLTWPRAQTSQNTFSWDPTLRWSQQPSLGSSSFGIETKAPGFL